MVPTRSAAQRVAGLAGGRRASTGRVIGLASNTYGCAGSTNRRGSAEVEDAVAAGAHGAAARRARDDLVRLCTAALLLEGVTRPRTAECVLCFAGRHEPPPELAPVLRWAADSYGAGGKDRAGPLAPPPGGLAAAARAVEALRRALSGCGASSRTWSAGAG